MVLAQFSLQAPGSWLCFSLILSFLLLSLKSQFPQHWHERLTNFAWFLIPYLGLLVGGLSPRLMGLNDIDWLASLGLGTGLIFVIILLLILVRATTEGNVNADALEKTKQASFTARRVIAPPPPAFSIHFEQIVKNGVEEFHWCFVRGAVWELLQTAPTPPSLPAYWAVWIAAALVAPETVLRQSAAQRLFNLVVLIATTVLFFYTRNFWLCWLLHVAAQFVINPRPVQTTLTGNISVR
ncbi:MAG: hypothetical protein U0350_05255 [Caldilineaceae bacterium]